MTRIKIGGIEATLEAGVWKVSGAGRFERFIGEQLVAIGASWRPPIGTYVPDPELAIAEYAADILGGTVVDHEPEPLPDGAIP